MAVSQSGQIKSLCPAASGAVAESTPLHNDPQDRFILACGESWRLSLLSAGVGSLVVVGSRGEVSFPKAVNGGNG